MEGKMDCDQRELSGICRELEETYDIAIAIEDPTLRTLTVTGTIEARSADKAIQALCLLTGHRYRQDHATFVLY
jgi:ferric-dicitrate binding protein FerR (iron transport regulator)